MYSDLLSLLRTKYEAEELLEELNGLLRSIYEGQGGKFDFVIQSAVRSEVAKIIKQDLEELKVDKQKYLEDVIEKIKSIEVLKIKVAYHPSEGDIEKIYTFVKKYVELDVLLEITTDPQIMGGAIFMYKGEYRDCSLLKTFNANKNAITTSLESSLSIS
jgi:F0F1-type ATP synthase delta subunit